MFGGTALSSVSCLYHVILWQTLACETVHYLTNLWSTTLQPPGGGCGVTHNSETCSACPATALLKCLSD